MSYRLETFAIASHSIPQHGRRFAAAGVVTAVAAALLASPGQAHHSPSVFDMGGERSLVGTVTAIEWANPHVYIRVEAAGSDGDSQEWEIEGGPLAMMRRRGWSADTLAVGDTVRVTGNPGRRDADRIIRLQSLSSDKGASIEFATAFAPRPEGLAPAMDLAGIWVAERHSPAWRRFTDASALPLTEKGMDALLAYDESEDDTVATCVPYTVPMMMLLPDIKSIEIGEEQVRIRGEFDATVRTIHLGQRPEAEASVLGHSVGRWEDDTLVVETSRYLPHAQGNGTSLASGTGKRTVERFRLEPDGESFAYSIELEDPEYLTEPVAGEARYAYRPDLAYDAMPCDLENARRFLRYLDREGPD